VRGARTLSGDSVEEKAWGLDDSDGGEAEGEREGVVEVSELVVQVDMERERVEVEGDGDKVLDLEELEASREELEDEEVEVVDSSERVELLEISMSECAMVYVEVVISSSSGVANATFFVAGKNGR
jgi:hypothetical protein